MARHIEEEMIGVDQIGTIDEHKELSAIALEVELSGSVEGDAANRVITQTG